MAEWIQPVAGPITSPFGPRRAPTPGATTFHAGVDIGANNGSVVVAQKAGRVAFAGLAAGFGGLVRVDHDGPHKTYSAHLSYIAVGYGQYVVQGQALGASGGRKGQWGAGTSTGSHCHVEHRINGTAVDPVPYWAVPAGGETTPLGEYDMTPEQDQMLTSIYRALFDIPVDDFAGRPGGLGRAVKDIRDALFKATETSFGTPGGVLSTLRAVTDKLGITKPTT